MGLQPGDTLDHGKYRIVRLLGRGGFGFVYLAEDMLLREEVAIKELIPGLVGDEVALKRFLAEAKATMHLTHERIVRTHGVFAERDNYYIAMEYMPGGSLEARLADHRMLSVDEAVQVAVDVAEGLAYAHERGIIHCDLKPANVLFTADGRAKVADFGVAHVSNQMLTRSWATQSGFIAGTLPYMSPEQADGVRNDPRIDVYSLGAVLYRMLTGRPYLAFEEEDSPRAQARNVQRIEVEQPSPPSVNNRRVPPWLDTVVIMALAKQAGQRFASAGALREALLRRTPLPQSTPNIGKTVVIRERGGPRQKVFWPWIVGSMVSLIALGAALLAADRAGVIQIGLASRILGPGRSPTLSSITALPLPTGTATATPVPPTAIPSPIASPSADDLGPLTAPTEPSTATPSPTASPTQTQTPTATYTETPVPTLTDTPTPAPTATAYAEVQKDGSSIRSGPGTIYGQVGTAPRGAIFVVVARSPDGGWLRLEGDDERWIAAAAAISTGDLPTPETIPPPPSPTPPRLGVAILVAPYNGYTADNRAMFQWRYSGPALNSNQGFELLLWQDGVAGQPGAAPIVAYIPNAGHVYTVSLGDIRASPGVRDKHWSAANVRWTVAVVQRNPYRRLTIATSRWIRCEFP